MTGRKSRRVVIINNINSDTIDQAIFILKSDKRDRQQKHTEKSIVHEAQNIINNYIRQVEQLSPALKAPKSPKRSYKKRNTAAFAASLFGLIGIAAAFIVFSHFLR